ncbi:MAG: hypothetical protein A2W91_11395 [Bacteroidetes bacterium GWF2_38_335]|nr:MAG: hypothetical protein A2W91_11395 [Bacteroidetes bacterium GWF2_38_335]OFY81699.1 MAG: hypothetical protein A2281_05650 [Bacteroidetes bacterium RIFOXYA12_FULL_38_20]HBS87763.1 hypothetical protein [Bacteroidales bacterium]
MKLRTLLLLFVISSSFLQVKGGGGNIDSLKLLLQKSNEKEKILLLNELAKEYLEISIDSGKYYAGEALRLSDKYGNEKEKANAYHYLGIILNKQLDFDGALKYFNKSLKIRKKTGDQIGVSKSLSNIGKVYQSLQQPRRALEYYNESLQIREKTSDKAGCFVLYYLIGNLYFSLEDHVNAEKYFRKTLKTAMDLNDYKGIISAYNSLGLINQNLSDDTDTVYKNRALVYYKKALEMAKDQEDFENISKTSNNIGSVYVDFNYYYKELILRSGDSIKNAEYYSLAVKNVNTAIEYYQLSLFNAEKLENKEPTASTLVNFAIALIELKKYDEAEEKIRASIQICESINDLGDLALNYFYLGSLYQARGNYAQALAYTGMSLEILKKLTISSNLRKSDLEINLFKVMAAIYENKGDYRMALLNFKEFQKLNDSVVLDEKSKLVEIQRLNYEKILSDADALYKATVKRAEAEKKSSSLDSQRKKLFISLLGLGLLAVIIVALILIRQNRRSKKVNVLLQEQSRAISQKNDELHSRKEELEHINLEVKKSIQYAEKIQFSALPDVKILNAVFPENFVFFKPRDIVSGDFYWWAEIEGKFLITAADCTGHGVPGAFMSILGISLIKEIVIKEYITHPGVILRKMRKEVINSLKQNDISSENISSISMRDGMDMVLVSYDKNNGTIEFSGANNPLYVISDRIPEGADKIHDVKYMDNSRWYLTEIPPDKMPVAIYEKMDKFNTHELQLRKGDMMYLISDGYPDQFGGPAGKKYKHRKLKGLLLEIAEKSMAEQKAIIESELKSWMGNLDQVDDITIIGVKIS